MTISVATERGTYPVVVSEDALTELPKLLTGVERVALIHSAQLPHLAETVAELCDTKQVLRLSVPDAEAGKSPKVLVDCWNSLAAAGFTRSDVVLGVGGGAVTDLAGFVAASWLRGVGYVSVPTSVLGMVDAAVGGKTGINLSAGKNLVGAFYEPLAVLCDLTLLRSLPSGEVASGLAEVVKCGFIADAEILALFRDNFEQAKDVQSEVFAELVRRAISVKADVVAADLTERTSVGDQVGREALNYGHTLGHAIEAREGYRLRHGQAISIGMCWMAEVSNRLLGLDGSLVSLHHDLLAGLGLPTSYEPTAYDSLRTAMSLDKKARGNTLRLVGLRDLGEPVILAEPPEAALRAAYDALRG